MYRGSNIPKTHLQGHLKGPHNSMYKDRSGPTLYLLM